MNIITSPIYLYIEPLKMDTLPNELVVEILESTIRCTKIHQFIKLELVCKLWRDLIRTYTWNVIVAPKKLSILQILLQNYAFHKFNFFKIIPGYNDEKYLNTLFPFMRKCTYLNLSTFRFYLRDEHIKYFQKVRHLDISRCYDITGRYLESLPTLESLVLTDNKKFQPVILSGLTQLTNLSIDACYQFTDEILDKLTNLQVLKLMCCNNFTIAGIAKLKSLRRFNAFACNKISKENVRAINLLIQNR